MYSKTKLYQKTVYDKVKLRSYDRLLKEANLQGSGDPKESNLEKPYKSKTYSQMQQEYNPPLPPVIDPGTGTGGLRCIWTSTGCEQLVGCWAGSDIVITGPEANTAGYIEPTIAEGEIISWNVSGSENRGIEILMSAIPRRNTFTVRFKDGTGVIHEEAINIDCNVITYNDEVIKQLPTFVWGDIKTAIYGTTLAYSYTTYDLDSNEARIVYSTWDGSAWSAEEIAFSETFSGASPTVLDFIYDSSGNPCVVHEVYGSFVTKVYLTKKASGTWTTTEISANNFYAEDYTVSLMVDSSGYLHCVGPVVSSGSIKFVHITNSSGSWVTEDCTGSYYSIYNSGAAIDSDNVIHLIVQHRTTSGSTADITHFYGTSGIFSSESVETDIDSTSSGGYGRIRTRVDSSKRVCFGLVVWTDKGKIYQKPNGGSWSSSTVTINLASHDISVTDSNRLRAVFSLPTPDGGFMEYLIDGTPTLLYTYNASGGDGYVMSTEYDSSNSIFHYMANISGYLCHFWRYL
jgi:hypothetical protein